MSEDWDDAEEKRTALRRVAAYRDLQKAVRKSSRGSLFFGAFMLLIWYGLFGAQNDFGVFSLVYLLLGATEFAVGLWNRIAPSAEGIFFDGAVLILFGVATLFRQYLIWQGHMRGFLSPFSLMFGAYWLWQGIGHIRSYTILRKAFTQRPTPEHIAWFDQLIAEIRQENPETDDTLLDLPTAPPVKVKLLGDTAIILFLASSEVLVIARGDLTIVPGESAGPDRLPQATLIIEGYEFSAFTLHPENWRNYKTWKLEGGHANGVEPL
ncbi:MAG: hypothetical protein LC104_08960 [Bacteroidales bacterium]|nr:hypothetical protein [Bacteroidales bacterium]